MLRAHTQPPVTVIFDSAQKPWECILKMGCVAFNYMKAGSLCEIKTMFFAEKSIQQLKSLPCAYMPCIDARQKHLPSETFQPGFLHCLKALNSLNGKTITHQSQNEHPYLNTRICPLTNTLPNQPRSLHWMWILEGIIIVLHKNKQNSLVWHFKNKHLPCSRGN